MQAVDPTTEARTKRTREPSAHTYATKLLQRLLPDLRPKSKGSPSAGKSLETLIKHWQESAKDKNAPKEKTKAMSGAERMRKNRIKQDHAEVWNMMTDADGAEKEQLLALVQNLDSKSGRAKLLAMFASTSSGASWRASSKRRAPRSSTAGTRTCGHTSGRPRRSACSSSPRAMCVRRVRDVMIL